MAKNFLVIKFPRIPEKGKIKTKLLKKQISIKTKTLY